MVQTAIFFNCDVLVLENETEASPCKYFTTIGLKSRKKAKNHGH
jgi:hypothetical protein